MLMLPKMIMEGWQVVQCVKGLAAKLDNLNSSPRIHMVEGKSLLSQVALCTLSTLWQTHKEMY